MIGGPTTVGDMHMQEGKKESQARRSHESGSTGLMLAVSKFDEYAVTCMCPWAV